MDFENEQELAEEDQAVQTKPENGQETDGDENLGDFIADTVKANEAQAEGGEEESNSDSDLSTDAVTLFEDDQYIFTSEGIIDRESLKSNNEENSENSEPKSEKDEKILGKFENYDELTDSYKELQKKLGENSEAVNKLRELNPVLPMLEAMLGDETFLEMAENYFTDPEAQAEAFKKQLGVDDQFVFDLNNALTDSKSEDAKVLNRLMQAKQPKQTHNNTQQTQTNPDAKKEVMEKYDLSDQEFDSMMQQAQNHKISHDDIYFLINKDQIIKKAKAEAAKEAQKKFKEQLSNAKSLRTNRTSSSSSNQQASPEDSFMSALKAGKGLFE